MHRYHSPTYRKYIESNDSHLTPAMIKQIRQEERDQDLIDGYRLIFTGMSILGIAIIGFLLITLLI